MKKSFRDRSPVGKALAVAVMLVSLVIVARAERDVQRRPAAEIRGGKLLWRLVSLNAVGALAYFRWGRVRS